MVRRFLSKGEKFLRKILHREIYYQSFTLRGTFYRGYNNTQQQFYSLDILDEIKDRSFLDIGCNIGGLVFLAEEHGAVSSIGIDISEKNITTAREIARKHDMKGVFHCADAIDDNYELPEADIVVCMAVFRHFYGMIKQKYDSEFKIPIRYLVYTSMNSLIRDCSTDDPRIKKEFNSFLSGLICKTHRRFICSFHDEAQLIIRRKNETEKYFRSLDQRIKNVEVYIQNHSRPGYVVVNLELSSNE